MERFNLLITGDRQLTEDFSIYMETESGTELVTGYNIIDMLINKVCGKQLTGEYEIHIRHADNDVDKVIHTWAKNHEYRAYTHVANWNRFGQSAAYYRNDEMFYFTSHADGTSGCIILTDCEDSVSRNAIYLSSQYKVPIRVWNYLTKSWLTGSQIKEIVDTETAIKNEFGRCEDAGNGNN